VRAKASAAGQTGQEDGDAEDILFAMWCLVKGNCVGPCTENKSGRRLAGKQLVSCSSS
jgi:hypothetical protein